MIKIKEKKSLANLKKFQAFKIIKKNCFFYE